MLVQHACKEWVAVWVRQTVSFKMRSLNRAACAQAGWLGAFLSICS